MTAGPKTVVVEYSGDDNYKPSYEVGNFTVDPAMVDPDMTVVDYGNGTVVVVLPEDATGNVTIAVDGKDYTVEVVNGTAVVQLENVTPGTHEVEVIYSGDGKYNSTSKETNITAPKYDSPMNITIGEIVAGENGTIVVTLPENAGGNVTVSVDGREYPAEVVNGTAVVRVDNLTAGPKTIVVEYSGDDNFKPAYEVGNFTVDPAVVNPDMTVVDYGNGTVVVVLPEDAAGNVTITVDGKDYTVEVVNGTAVVQLENVTPGTHEVEVIYSGDGKYNSTSKETNITAPKYDSPMNITIGEIVAGENGTIVVTLPENAGGNVTVSVDGREYPAEVVNGTAVVRVDNLTAGPKTIVVEYSGDDNFKPAYEVGNFTVDPAMVDPDMTVVDHGNGTVVVVLPEDATGNVTITVDGKDYTAEVVNGTAVVLLDNVTPGTHEVEVIYTGDGKYNSTTKTTNITAPKYDSPMNITIGKFVAGENGTIIVTLPEDATGNVTVSVDGREYPAEVIDGVAVVRVDNLTAGPKTIVVEYSGDDNYMPAYEVGNFTVDSAMVDPDMAVVDYGNGTVVVVLPEDASGNVTITVDGKDYTAEVVNGTAVVQLDNVTPGTHEVEVIYAGDGKYNSTTKVVNITAPKYDSPINITIGEIVAGEDGTIIVTLPEDATGNVTVSVDGREYPAEVIDGVAVVRVDNLTAGPKTIVVEYSGDDNYMPAYEVGNFTVDSAMVDPDMAVVDYGNGTVVVVLPEDASGNVTITVDGKEFNTTVINGTAVVQLDNVTPGTHEVEVIYSGDGKYNSTSKTTNITAPKLDTPITVEAPDSKVGDKAIIIVTLPDNATGNVTIEIDGVKHTSEINDGKAVFEIENLTAGTKTIAVDYTGDSNYVANHTTGNTIVSKRPSTVNATVEDINVGENATITVYVPEDATGQVLVDIGGQGYYVNVTDGVGVLTVPDLTNGTYDINVTYVGDDKYLSSSNVSGIKVSKVKPFVIPTAYDIYVGDVEIIRFSVPEDATGTLTVVVDGEEYEFTLNQGTLGAQYSPGEKYSVAIANGYGELAITGLPKGEYVVSVKYNGDDKYSQVSNVTTFKVMKKGTDMNVFDQGNGTVVVVLPDDAEGNVTITVGGKTFVSNVTDGIAIVDLDGVPPGEYEMTVKYSGDDNYNSTTEKATVVVPKRAVPISVSVSDISVGDTEVITVSVPKGATGKVTIEIDAKEYTATIKNGKATFQVTGLKYGDKTVAVTYSGDDNYGSNFTTGQFKVKKRTTTVKATSQNINVGTNEIIVASVLPKDATGRVLVNINGVGYYGTIIDGKAKVVIPELFAGKYTAKVTYEGDDKYLSSTITTSFTVSKVKTPIRAEGDEIMQGEEATVVVNVPEDATGTVTITVKGNEYTADVEDGKAVFVVPNLSKGDYGVTARYSGNKKYEANDTITDIEVYFNEPQNNTNHTDGNESTYHSSGSVKGAVNLANYPTGNPIWILLLILLALGSTQLRRFKD